MYGVGGHSFVGSEEFFYRAGGLENISPMYELTLGLFAGGQKSTMLEREESVGDKPGLFILAREIHSSLPAPTG